MTIRTIQHWNKLISVWETGRIPMGLNDRVEQNVDLKDKRKFFREFLKNDYDHLMKLLKPKVEKTVDGVYFSVDEKMIEQKQNLDDLGSKGFSLNIHNDQLVVGSPNYGVYRGRVEIEKQIFEPSVNTRGKFGSQIIFLDFNLDGISDIVVSSPSWNSQVESRYPPGMVSIYFGEYDGKFSSLANVSIVGDDGSSTGWSSIGTSLSVGDVDLDGRDDLVIGSPFDHDGRGSVTVYFSRRDVLSEYLNRRDASTLVIGEKRLSYCGSSTLVLNGTILIGCPTYNLNINVESSGLVVGFMWNKKSLVSKFELVGSTRFEQLGSNLAGGGQLVAITHGSRNVENPTRFGAGSVSIIENIHLFCGRQSFNSIAKKVVFEGDRSHARLAWAMGFHDFNSDGRLDFYISEPFRDVKSNNDGRVYVVDGARFPSGIVKTMSTVAKVFESPVLGARFGYSLVANKNKLYIGAPFSQSTGYFSGSVHVVEL